MPLVPKLQLGNIPDLEAPASRMSIPKSIMLPTKKPGFSYKRVAKLEIGNEKQKK